MEFSEFTNAQLKAINDGANRAYAVGRGVVEFNDCKQEAWLWVYENIDTVRRWEDTDRRHDKLKTACYQAGLAMIRAQMRHTTGAQKQDFVTYSTGYIQDLLPVLFTGSSFNTGDEVNVEVKTTTAPNEGGNGLVSLIDVQRGFAKLTQEQKRLLFLLYHRGDTSYDDVAKELQVSAMTVRRREQRALEAIVDNLGGPRAEARKRERDGVQ